MADPVTCVRCGKDFGDRYDLAKHLRRKTDCRRYLCACGRSFDCFWAWRRECREAGHCLAPLRLPTKTSVLPSYGTLRRSRASALGIPPAHGGTRELTEKDSYRDLSGLWQFVPKDNVKRVLVFQERRQGLGLDSSPVWRVELFDGRVVVDGHGSTVPAALRDLAKRCQRERLRRGEHNVGQ